MSVFAALLLFFRRDDRDVVFLLVNSVLITQSFGLMFPNSLRPWFPLAICLLTISSILISSLVILHSNLERWESFLWIEF